MKITFFLKSIFLISLITLLISCSSKNAAHIPENVLPMDKMAALLTDAHILEAALNLNLSNEAQAVNERREETMLAVLKKHKINKEQFDESFKYYGQHPEEFGEVYKLVLNNLSELQAKTAAEKEPVKDTIKAPAKKP